MMFNLSLPALISAGGGIAFALVAFLAALSRGGGRARVLFALGCLGVGASTALTSLTYPDQLPGIVAVTLACTLAAIAFAALAVEIVRPFGPRATWTMRAAVGAYLVLGLVAAFGPAVSVMGAVAEPPARLVVPTGRAIAAIVVAMGTIPFVWIACAARARALTRDESADVHGWSALSLATAFPSFMLLRWVNEPFLPAVAGVGILVGVVAAIAWLPRGAEARPDVLRKVAHALLGIGLFVLVYDALLERLGWRDVGLHGLAHTLGALVLARAIIGRALLGIEPPALAIARGPLAAGSLASLFIVAQIGQNFLSARYGLLMGGVVAGAFLFAAAPIQRAFEAVRDPAPRAAPDAPPPASPAAHETYRKALRLALHDGAMTREEERHLADLAHDLGVTYRDALALRDDVERELAAAR